MLSISCSVCVLFLCTVGGIASFRFSTPEIDGGERPGGDERSGEYSIPPSALITRIMD